MQGSTLQRNISLVPRKNSIKTYYENGVYHVYNRGVEKRNIFLDTKDYSKFLCILESALTIAPLQGTTLQRRQRKNFFGQIELLAYCLMPNHYHFLIKQSSPTSMSEFLHSIRTTYAMYFNEKYERVGPLFQGIFRAIDVRDDNYLLWVSRYIHRNPINTPVQYSSYLDYLSQRQTSWINKDHILNYFNQSSDNKLLTYKKFVENDTLEVENFLFLGFENP